MEMLLLRQIKTLLLSLKNKKIYYKPIIYNILNYYLTFDRTLNKYYISLLYKYTHDDIFVQQYLRIFELYTKISRSSYIKYDIGCRKYRRINDARFEIKAKDVTMYHGPLLEYVNFEFKQHDDSSLIINCGNSRYNVIIGYYNKNLSLIQNKKEQQLIYKKKLEELHDKFLSVILIVEENFYYDFYIAIHYI